MPNNLRNALINAYLRDLDTKDNEFNTLQFGYIPEEISESKTANYNLIDIPGRSEPIYAYMNSSPREISLHIMFVAGIGQDKTVNTGNSTIEDDAVMVKQKVDWLRSLVYPDYSVAGIVRPPHRILVSIGNLIKSICITTSVSPVYKAPWDESLLPYIAEVDISFQEVNEVPYGSTDIKAGKQVNSL